MMDIPFAAVQPQCEKPPYVEYLERKGIFWTMTNSCFFMFISFLSSMFFLKGEKDSDFYEVSEESAGFTGQRLNKKMQVYSGAKTIFLPNMMSLYQLCIRTLQNNIDCE